jgi:hypothetical protein
LTSTAPAVSAALCGVGLDELACPQPMGRLDLDGLLAWIELAVAPGDAGLNSLAEDTNWLPTALHADIGCPGGRAPCVLGNNGCSAFPRVVGRKTCGFR